MLLLVLTSVFVMACGSPPPRKKAVTSVVVQETLTPTVAEWSLTTSEPYPNQATTTLPPAEILPIDSVPTATPIPPTALPPAPRPSAVPTSMLNELVAWVEIPTKEFDRYPPQRRGNCPDDCGIYPIYQRAVIAVFADGTQQLIADRVLAVLERSNKLPLLVTRPTTDELLLIDPAIETRTRIQIPLSHELWGEFALSPDETQIVFTLL